MNRKIKAGKVFIFLKKINLIFFAALIKSYQYALSPFLGQNCRHYPSCSHYSLESLNKYGFLKGGLLTFLRILRCNPWSLGGYDPVPENVSFKKISSFKFVGNYQTKLYQQNIHGKD